MVALATLPLAACGAKSAASTTPAALVPSPTPIPSSFPDAHVGDTIFSTDNDEFTVYQVAPVNSSNQFLQPKAGDTFVAIDVKEKAGPNGLHANPYDFALVMDDDTRYEPYIGVKEPALNATTLGAGQAVRGWVTFEIPTTAKLVRVFLTGSTDIFWDVP